MRGDRIDLLIVCVRAGGTVYRVATKQRGKTRLLASIIKPIQPVSGNITRDNWRTRLLCREHRGRGEACCRGGRLVATPG